MKTSFFIAVGLAILTVPQLHAQTWKSPSKHRERPAVLNQRTKPGLAANSSTNRFSAKPEIKELKVTERGASHSVWQYKTAVTNQAGAVSERVHSYTELATGLNFKNEGGEWETSDPEIVVAADGKGRAQNAPHHFRLPAAHPAHRQIHPMAATFSLADPPHRRSPAHPEETLCDAMTFSRTPFFGLRRSEIEWRVVGARRGCLTCPRSKHIGNA